MSEADKELVVKPEWLSYMRKYSKCSRINGFPGEFAAQAVAEVDRLTAELAQHKLWLKTEGENAAQVREAMESLTAELRYERIKSLALQGSNYGLVANKAQLTADLKVAREALREVFDRTVWSGQPLGEKVASICRAALASQPTGEGDK